MDVFVDERDRLLLNEDKYTFSVLSRIISGENELLLSDHEKTIICFSCQPYPVWIWTPDDASEDGWERAYILAKENALLDGDHHFNMKYELAEYFISRAKREGLDFSVTTNLYAYDCLTPIAPAVKTDGKLHLCKSDDLDELVDFYEMFRNAVGIDQESREQYRIQAEDGIRSGRVYFWENSSGKAVASCNWHPVNDMASIGLVYTREEERRKQKMPDLCGGGICRRLFYAALRRVRFVRLGSKERITRVFRDGYGHAACGERPERGKRGGSGGG